MAFLFLFLACAAFEPIGVREEKYGKSVPAIHQSFASTKLRPGDTWKIYLNASDADGDLKSIICTVDHLSGGGSALRHIKIKEENRKELSGYIYWNTRSAYGVSFSNIKLTVQIEDMAGHLSAPVSFLLSLQQGYRQEDQPKDIFKDKDLGPILINLRRDPFLGYPEISG